MTTKKYFPLAFIAFLSTTLMSCKLVEGIFKAGMWTGVIVVVLVLALIIWLISKVFGG
ncbi:cytosine/uracil/thiamine/allantoin permease [Pedobacter sp. AK017]|uniref:hypothetical protein n=1 Tax=Pedobacter sp. AK017 TaxID=2723073 RepID=UPI001617E218|nr:hypothetical protein [Pedobacter sp. AK017]MBB5438078.1 cytosine/uracil/thiamine/allantoin permease [Pedobacter sp. AK017]